MRQRKPSVRMTAALWQAVKADLNHHTPAAIVSARRGLSETAVRRIASQEQPPITVLTKKALPRFELVSVRPLSESKTGRSYSMAPEREKQSA